ncbi:unnamed protein product, partial [Choristocarpus tenellus]
MLSSEGPEVSFKDGCLSLRAETIAKLRAKQAPGPKYEVPSGFGPQQLSTFRSQPMVGWGTYTAGVREVGRPVESAFGKDTPGPQYELDRVTSGHQVQSKFKTAPTPVFGGSIRRPLNDTGIV